MTDSLVDLYQVFRARVRARDLAIHPHRWLTKVVGNAISCALLDQRLARGNFGRRVPFEEVSLLRIHGTAITDVREASHLLRRITRKNGFGLYLAHPLLAKDYEDHIPVGNMAQGAVLDFLKEHIPSLQLEVPTSDGRVDALAPRAVIEVVRLSSWKTGLGQLCADRRHFPQLAPVLWIYGDDSRPPPAAINRVRKTCWPLGIRVAYTKCAGPPRRELSHGDVISRSVG